jgi:hypothetical protein
MNKINKFLMVGILLMAVVVPLTTWLAVRNQENRSSAATDASGVVQFEAVDGACGSVNGTTVSSLPSVIDACAQGAVNWMDREGTDGEYNWDCFGTVGKRNVECIAKKQ